MKVTIERESCTMCAICWDICPQFFEESPEDGYSQVIEEYRINGKFELGEAPDELSDCVTEAANGCPVEIIHLEDE